MLWLKRIAMWLAAAAVVLLLTGASYEQVMRRHAAHDIAMPGRLVDVGGGRRIQIDCRGTGSPTVVLESGLDHLGSLSWAAVHDSLAVGTRVCAYSRAGILWSDPAPTSFDVRSVARDLHAALIAAGESAPWVMVGHSIGGPYVMAFIDAYPREVRGLVFVDASHPEQFARFRAAVGKDMEPPPGLVRVGAALAWTGLVRALPAPDAPPSWPSIVAREATLFLSPSLTALAHETSAIPSTLASARAMRRLGDRPLVVLTAGREQPDAALRAMEIDREQGARLQAVTRAMHDDQATWSTNSRHEIVPDATHYIQFDRPDVVIRAVREVVGQVASTTPASATP